MHLLIARYILSLGSVAVSLLLGLFLFAMTVIYNDAMLVQLSRYAGSIRDWLVSYQGWPKAELVARLVLHDSTILLMFYTLAARAIIGFVTLIFQWLFKRY